MVLSEERVMDAKLGIQLNPGFGDYKLPGSAEMPELARRSEIIIGENASDAQSRAVCSRP